MEHRDVTGVHTAVHVLVLETQENLHCVGINYTATAKTENTKTTCIPQMTHILLLRVLRTQINSHYVYSHHTGVAEPNVFAQGQEAQ
jgi:hypothetical protein